MMVTPQARGKGNAPPWQPLPSTAACMRHRQGKLASAAEFGDYLRLVRAEQS